ncbi:MAG TPA: cyclodeaminase/cyclohydrolase family protein, partial [bacterium]|nr:cyclodeaminase/cyclohydrolase family protein [bacterium]
MDGREPGRAEIRARTVGEFLDALASPTPTPGGGSAAAVAGAMAAALAAMVARLSKGKGGDDLAFERAAQAADRA